MYKTATITLMAALLLSALHAQSQYSIAELDLDGTMGSWYDSIYGENSPELYEGAFYEVVGRTSVSQHPFLGSGSWEAGSLNFRGQDYEGVYMFYDLINGQLVLQNPKFTGTGLEYLQINQDQIASFELFDHYFEHFYKGFHPPPGPGFYEILYEGDHLRLVAQKRKEKRYNKPIAEFKVQVRYFLEIGDSFTGINSGRSLYQVFPEQKRLLKDYVSRNGLKMKKGNDSDFAAVVSFCDQLLSDR